MRHSVCKVCLSCNIHIKMKTKHDISQLVLVKMSWRTRHGQTGFDDESQTPGHSEAEEELGRGPGFSRESHRRHTLLTLSTANGYLE